MKIIKPSVEFFGEVPTDYKNALKFIEMAGRTCYKSEDKITDSSAEPFVKRLIKAGHLAMVEHSNFVVRSDYWSIQDVEGIIGKYLNACFDEDFVYVGGNLTAWYNLPSLEVSEMFSPFINTFGHLFGFGEDEKALKWQICPHNEIPKELHRYSARFICDRGVSHELVRHRPCSFAQESTRYVSYNGKEMEFIEPVELDDWPIGSRQIFAVTCQDAEFRYNRMLQQGMKPQQARAVLPNALKTEIIVTADAAEWRHIKSLRNVAPPAHPDMARVMNMMPWEDFL